MVAQAAREGFHPEVHDGVVYYCRKDFPMNSRIPVKQCVTEPALKARLLAAEAQREQMQRAGAAPNCTNAGTC